MTDSPLISLRGVGRSYRRGGTQITVLSEISIDFHAGEFVAIIGASGSGKSTLLNILGLLDRPTKGTYRLGHQDVTLLTSDNLADIRCAEFGFIFQQYNLIETATAQENVEKPAVYAGVNRTERAGSAADLLTQFGLGDRRDHRPAALSGGQQQRVAIARALVNNAPIILADEPTGALDSKSGADIMQLLCDLARNGHTIIFVTHDPQLAQLANRQIEIADGRIVSDTERPDAAPCTEPLAGQNIKPRHPMAGVQEALVEALRALAASPIRTTLTLLGVIIGTAAVIALLGIGEGARQTVLDQWEAYGSARLYVEPSGGNPLAPGGLLTVKDATVIRQLPNVDKAMPWYMDRATVRFGDAVTSTALTAVTSDYPSVNNWPLTTGRFFTEDDEKSLATVAVLGSKVRDVLFPGGIDPIRKFILVNDVPFQVIGILSSKGSISGDINDDDQVVIPLSTGAQRIFGTEKLSEITVTMKDPAQSTETTDAITAALTNSRHMQDFDIFNKAAATAAKGKTANTLTRLLGFTAAISLLVGGIGIMNIMLTAVSERTREIGIRVAIGARQRDITNQFLFEAVVLAGVGGLSGLVLGHAFGLLASLFGTRVIFTLHAAVIAFTAAAAAGVVFGYMPARRAARLDPIVALARA